MPVGVKKRTPKAVRPEQKARQAKGAAIMTIYRGYEVGDDEETEGKKDGVDAILADKDGHSCTQPLNRKCWDCGFCIDRPGCGEPVDGYGNPI